MFAKVAEERSFAAAARMMGVSVATVSRAVTRLEERLGGRLFNRTSRRLALTDLGNMLAERASKMYADAEEAELYAREASRRPRGLIKLAAPLSFGVTWVAPILPDFFRQYPEITLDLHLTDAHVDLIGDGFDAALRIAVLVDSSLVAKLIAPVRRFVVASPRYIARYGRPQHPQDLGSHQCLSYNTRPRLWKFKHRETGEEVQVTPAGLMRGNTAEALLPTVLDGQAITEIPEFIATEHFAKKELEPQLLDWQMPEGGLYFVTPTARARPAKVSALADFMTARLSDGPWRLDTARKKNSSPR